LLSAAAPGSSAPVGDDDLGSGSGAEQQETMVRRIVTGLVGVIAATSGLAQPAGVVIRETPLVGSAGTPIGTVIASGSANATVLRILVAPGGLTPGWHGVHLHAVGDCSDPGQFLRSRGPVDHLIKSHGLLHPAGPKEGDLPNIYANPDGSANAEMLSHAVRMLGQTGLVEGDGSALVIHAQEDDHLSQPLGNTGNRVACAAFR
jgi:Cu-Zn family superoxide dismutase